MPPDEVHIGCQVGKVYRLVLLEQEVVYAILVVLLEFIPQARKKTFLQNAREQKHRHLDL